MTLREQLVAVADAYQAGHGLNETTLSKRLFGNTKRLGEIRRAGGDVQTQTFERAMLDMSGQWPAGAVWPAQVARP